MRLSWSNIRIPALFVLIVTGLILTGIVPSVFGIDLSYVIGAGITLKFALGIANLITAGLIYKYL